MTDVRSGLMLAACLSLGVCAFAYGADAGDPDWATRDQTGEPPGTVTSIEATATPYASGNQFSIAADYAIHNRHYDYAIKLCKRALAADPDDLDIHKTYATALEQKLKIEKTDDPDLFNACLREWLIVMRMERGPEKLPQFHGIIVPGYSSLYGDEEYSIEARYHLQAVAGTVPKPWESDSIYLKRAGKATTSTVTGKILKSPSEKSDDRSSAKQQPAPPPPAAKPDPLDWLNGN